MTEAPAPTSLLALLAGLALPVAILGGGYSFLVGPSEDRGQVTVFEERLAESEPMVVILGSSLANRGIDMAVLARELRIEESKIVMLQLPHSASAHWFAVLKNRVFGNGYNPRLVLIVGAMTTFLNHDQLANQANVERLVAQLGESEPVIANKVFQFDSEADFRTFFLRERASRYRQDLLTSWRNLVVTTLFTRRGSHEEGRRLADKVNEEVFANAQMDYELHKRESTGIGGRQSTSWLGEHSFDLKRDGLIPDMQALVSEHDANLVYIRYPFPPSNQNMDEVPVEIEEEALDWLDEVGSGFVDMRSLDLDDSMYEDMRHMTREGAQRFTSAVGRAVMEMDGMEEGEGVTVVRGLPPPADVAYTGTWPELPALDDLTWTGEGCRASVDAQSLAVFSGVVREAVGTVRPPVEVRAGTQLLDPKVFDRGCVGSWKLSESELILAPPQRKPPSMSIDWAPLPEGIGHTDHEPVWIPPGQSLSFTFDRPWTQAEHMFDVQLRGNTVGAEGVPVSVSVDDSRFDLLASGNRVFGGSKLPAPTKVWTLSVSSPANGPWVYLHHLAVGVAPSTTYLLGAAETIHGASVRLIGGRYEDLRSKPSFAADPPAFPVQPRLRPGGRKVAWFSMPKFTDLADAVDADHARPNRCSPVRVLEDGVPLKQPHAVCYDVMTKGAGRSCFAGDQLHFAASDDSNPVTNGRKYTIDLDPKRLCETLGQKKATTLRDSLWMYPGDVVELRAPPNRMQSFHLGPNVLDLETMPVQDPLEEPLRVQIEQGGVVVLDETWQPGGKGRRRDHTFIIDPPLPPQPEDVVVRITNPVGKSFQLVTMATLAERDQAAPEGEVTITTHRRQLVPSSMKRGGSIPAVPMPKKVGPTEQGGFEAKLFPMWAVSDSALEKIGLGPVSPLHLEVAGVELTRRSDRAPVRGDCTACFAHMGQALLYFPEDKDGEIVPSLDTDFPMVGPDGREVWWIYPGMWMQFEFDDPPVGELTVTVDGRAFHPQRDQAGGGARMAIGETVQAMTRIGAGTDSSIRGMLYLPEAPEGPWSMRLWSESVPEFLLIEEIRVEDAQGRSWVLPRGDGGLD